MFLSKSSFTINRTSGLEFIVLEIVHNHSACTVLGYVQQSMDEATSTLAARVGYATINKADLPGARL